MLSKAKGHHLQLRCHPLLFHTFKQCNIKATPSLHSIIQKEVGEFLTRAPPNHQRIVLKCFVVPKHTGGLWPILNFTQFYHFMHIPIFKMPTVRQVWQFIQQGDYAFLLIRDAYLHVPIVIHYHYNSWFVWQHKPFQWRLFPFGLATAPRVFTSLTKPTLFLCRCKGFLCWNISEWYSGPDSLLVCWLVGMNPLSSLLVHL